MTGGFDFSQVDNNPYNEIAKQITWLVIAEFIFIIVLLIIAYSFRFNRTFAQVVGVIGTLAVFVVWMALTIL